MKIADKDKPVLEEIKTLQPPCPANPQPHIVAAGRKMMLLYYTPDAREVVAVDFSSCTSYKLGVPQTEAELRKHPLYKFGLQPNAVYRVRNSPWAIEIANTYWDDYRDERGGWDPPIERHFVFTFRDTTFECLSSDFLANTFPGPMAEAYRTAVNLITLGEDKPLH
jgi:hypothetical protein